MQHPVVNLSRDPRDFSFQALYRFLKISLQFCDAFFLAVDPFAPQRTALGFQLRQFFPRLAFDFFHLIAAAMQIRNQIARFARFRREAGLRIFHHALRKA